MAPSSSTRQTVSAAALIVGVWVLLAGLFAMHALPMQQPMATTGSTTGSTTGAMTGAIAMPAATAALTAGSIDMATHHQSTTTTDDVGPVGDAPAASDDAVPASSSADRQVSAVPAAGCEGADHCTATLRTPLISAVPAVVTVVDPSAPALQRTGLQAPSAPQPRPPDLDTLQISRT